MYYFETIEYQDGLPIKMFVHSVSEIALHWHNDIEIIFVIKGSVNVNIQQSSFLLKENDIMLINCNEVHSTIKTDEDNILLALQINPKFCKAYYPELSHLVFDCKSFLFDPNGQERFDLIRHYMASVMWELNKKAEGYKLNINSRLNDLIVHLIRNFNYFSINDQEVKNNEKDLDRLKRIIDYVDENYTKKISLKEIAKLEYLNFYYLSHFFKDKVGLSFQEYVVNIRVRKAIELLLSSNKTITEISLEVGFSDTKYLYKYFKDKFNCKPNEYKSKFNLESITDYKKANGNKIGYLDFESTAIFEGLFKYLNTDKEQLNLVCNNITEQIDINVQDKSEPLNAYWKKLTTFGRAVEGLREEWRNQFREMQREIGFEYIRFHGIFNDEMMVYNLNSKGEPVFNWNYVDQLFDFFKEVNIKPFVELGFMPTELRKSEETVYWWKGNVSGPKDMKEWTDLVCSFIKHCMNRYGIAEVESWYFEVWNEPDYEGAFWVGSKEEYFEFYRSTALVVHSISNKLKVGGPSLAFLEDKWIEDFLDYCKNYNVPLDFFSFHVYPSVKRVGDGKRRMNTEVFCDFVNTRQTNVNNNKNSSVELIHYMSGKIKDCYGKNLETHVTEWNVTPMQRHLVHDTAFMATFILETVLKSFSAVDSLGFWTFTDIFEEYKAGVSPFHGGFGLFNRDGIKKSAYMAYYLLAKLGNELVLRGDNYIVTKKNEDFQILLYNYIYFDELFLNGDISGMTHTERYSIFEEKGEKIIGISISGLDGNYKIKSYSINREYGSAFDAWTRMGAPQDLLEEDICYLKKKAMPEITIDYLNLTVEYKKTVKIPSHGALLMTLEKEY